MSIKEALAKLDPKNDGHWTKDGQPSLELVRIYAKSPKLTREEITSADPAFNRAAASGTPVQAAEPVEQTFKQPEQPAQTPAQIATAVAASEPSLETVDEKWTEERALRAEIAELQERFQEAVRAEAEIVQWKKDAAVKLEQLQRKLPKDTRPVTSPNMAYLESQKRLAQERADRQKELLAEGLTPSRIASLLPHVNPIDKPRKK